MFDLNYQVGVLLHSFAIRGDEKQLKKYGDQYFNKQLWNKND
jgi:hypothetical protein